jgi:alpha/beta superfamily hydrolase
MWQRANKEESVFINSEPGVRLEALIAKNNSDKGVVIAHPHPLYGGNMYNNVVEAITQAYYSEGYTTIRFNFRGVGRSTGTFDNGIGESEDLKTVLRYLESLKVNKTAVAGYSFGSWVIASCLKDLNEIEHALFVSPPVAVSDFSSLKDGSKVKLVITGSYDDIAPAEVLKDMLSKWNPEAKLIVIEGADHFYWGYSEEIKRIIIEFLRQYRGT